MVQLIFLVCLNGEIHFFGGFSYVIRNLMCDLKYDISTHPLDTLQKRVVTFSIGFGPNRPQIWAYNYQKYLIMFGIVFCILAPNSSELSEKKTGH